MKEIKLKSRTIKDMGESAKFIRLAISAMLEAKTKDLAYQILEEGCFNISYQDRELKLKDFLVKDERGVAIDIISLTLDEALSGRTNL